MSRIYGEAAAVWSYTGRTQTTTELKAELKSIHGDFASLNLPESPPSRVIELITRVSDMYRNDVQHGSITLPTDPLGEIFKEPFSWIFLMDVLTRPYFGRRWILQEISMNESVYIFWDGVLFDLRLITTCRQVVASRHQLRYSAAYYPSLPAFLAMVEHFDLQMQGPGLGLLLARELLKVQAQQKSSSGLFRIFAMGCMLKQTVEQDIFFALRSLAPDGSSLPRPDYSMSPSEICLRHALYFMDEGMAPAVLQFAGQRRALNRHELPTWCPQWHFPDCTNTVALTYTTVITKSRPTDLISPLTVWSYQSDTRSLNVQGLLETHIAHTIELCASPPSADRFKQQISYFRALFAPYQPKVTPSNVDIEHEIENLKPLAVSDGIQLTQKFCRRLKTLAQLEYALLIWLHLFKHVDSYQDLVKLWPSLVEMRHALVTGNPGTGAERIALMANGMVGVVDQDAQAGDVVAMIPGCWLPLILREKKREKGVYEHFGSAFILYLKGRQYFAVLQERYDRPIEFSEDDFKNLQDRVLE